MGNKKKKMKISNLLFILSLLISCSYQETIQENSMTNTLAQTEENLQDETEAQTEENLEGETEAQTEENLEEETEAQTEENIEAVMIETESETEESSDAKIPLTQKTPITSQTGGVWGTDRNDNIYTRPGISGNWQHIGGKLKNIAVGEDGRVWGTDRNDNIYTRPGISGNWQKIG